MGFVQNTDFDDEIIKINGDNPLDKALDAKIVLPTSLFVEDENGSTMAARTSSGSALSAATQQRLRVIAQKEIVANKAIQRKDALQKLNTELEKFQKTFHKSEYKAYQTAYNEYLEQNREAIALYESKLEEVENQITEETPEEEKQRLYDTLKPFEVAPFQYSSKSEINLPDLQSKLSLESFELFLELFSEQEDLQNLPSGETEILSDNQMRIGVAELQISDSYQTMSDVFGELQNQISAQSQIALENSPLPQQQYVNIGGATIPVATNTGITHLAYSLLVDWNKRIFTSGIGFVNFSFEVENASWEVASAKLVATTNAGNFEENKSAISVVNNKIVFPGATSHHFTNVTHLKIDIYFANGREATLELGSLNNNQLYNGLLMLKPVKAELPDLEGSTEQGTPKRKNFGIKRLGVADYLKVVQSVHAYVPGEVSNIENVMASELRHKSSVARDYSEITDTTSKSQETEKISDTTKTSRTDMQTEVAKELDKQQSFNAHANYGKRGDIYYEIGAEYANNTAQHDSTRQAVMKSQEITERAMERVLTKISEERVQKIIKEYTETNVHEFDNRGKVTDTDNPDAAQPKHITGVYRWIDKKMKNQIYNYGKRAMFEFMVPEPAKLHRLATAVAKAQVLTAPVDPRTAQGEWNMPNPKSATTEQIEHWAQIYGVTLTEKLPATKTQSVGRQDFNLSGNEDLRFLGIDIADNYKAKSARIVYGHNRERHGTFGNKRQTLFFSNFNGGMNRHDDYDTYYSSGDTGFFSVNTTGHYDYQYRGENLNGCFFAFTFNCELSDAYLLQWKTENFNAIIAAYEAAYKKFQEDQAALDAAQAEKEADSKEKTSNFYRYMESDVLKHNCIAYLLQDYLHTLGQVMTNGSITTTTMENYEVYLGENLDKYTALAKFMEQAFEWEIMDYTFYPYYWANRKEWQTMYISESVDPLFRSFLQAGMARVIVTVKPGFEDAVQFFLETGLIWNGGEVPVIGDPLYMSIVDEMRQPTGKPQGKFWITRIPTTLTILQDSSTGLPVNPLQPLPIFPDDANNCENPSELELGTSFRLDETSQLQHGDHNASTLD